jgi:N utilization substance protein A
VTTDDENIDPVGSCVGQRGTRVQTVIAELGGEKIDIIEWSDDSEKFITQALSPAKVISVTLQPEEKVALVKVAEDQLSLAIGRSGQNVRLASKLSGWKIDILAPDGAPVLEPESAEAKSEEATDNVEPVAEVTSETETTDESAS